MVTIKGISRTIELVTGNCKDYYCQTGRELKQKAPGKNLVEMFIFFKELI